MKKTKLRTLVEYLRPEQEKDYLKCLQRGVGFVANCWKQYGNEKGDTVHRADCYHLRKGGRNPRSETGRPITDIVWKLWAATIDELDINAGHKIYRCGSCFRAENQEG
jgi:hypothetical protein